MPRDKRDIESALTGKGFTRREGDPHDFVYMAHQGQQSRAHTKTSHTPKMKEISDGLLGPMAKPFGLTKPEFLDRVDYPLSREAYDMNRCWWKVASYEPPDSWLVGIGSRQGVKAGSGSLGRIRFTTRVHIGHG